MVGSLAVGFPCVAAAVAAVPVCASHAGAGIAGKVAGGIAGAGMEAVFGAAGRWVAGGASWLLDRVGLVLSSTTTVGIGSTWFARREAVMAGLCGAVVLPMACFAAIQAVYRQSASGLLRVFLVNLPLALLLSGLAVTLVRMALAITDALSSAVAAGAGLDTRHLLAPLSTFLVDTAAVAPGVPTFVVFAGSLLVAGASLALWLELIVRAAAIAAATLFLPLVLCAMVWPAVAHWCRRLADTLVALVLSKLVMVAILSLGVGALASATGPTGGHAVSGALTGTALLVLAAFAPYTLLHLVPAIEGGAVSQLHAGAERLRSAGRAPAQGVGAALQLLDAATFSESLPEIGMLGDNRPGSGASVPLMPGTPLPSHPEPPGEGPGSAPGGPGSAPSGSGSAPSGSGSGSTPPGPAPGGSEADGRGGNSPGESYVSVVNSLPKPDGSGPSGPQQGGWTRRLAYGGVVARVE